MKFHDYLRKLRESRGLTLADVSEACGVGRSAICKDESGKFWWPRGGTLTKILAGLGVKEGDPEHSQAVALWSSCRLGKKASPSTRDKLMARIGQLDSQELIELRDWLEAKAKERSGLLPQRRRKP